MTFSNSCHSGILTVQEKKILLIISGGIAAYKAPELIRLFREFRVTVNCVLTNSGSNFVTPLTLAAISGNKVYQD